MTKLEKLIEVMDIVEDVCDEFQSDKEDFQLGTLVGIGSKTWVALEALQSAVKDLKK